MRSKGNRRDKPLFRPIPALLALVAGLALSVAIAGASLTQLGTTTNVPTLTASAPVVAGVTVPGAPSYVLPDGVLTKWRYHSGAPDPSKIRLKIYRATGNPKEYKVIEESSSKNLDADKGYEFDERMPVTKGDILGLYGQEAALGVASPDEGNKVGMFVSGDMGIDEVGTTTTSFDYRLVNVAATVESDADKDGYGDDTQDQCPTDPKIHSSKCPATTTPKDNRRPKVTLGSASKQNLVRQKGVFVTAGSDENGTVRATATLSIEKVHFSKSYSMITASSAITAGARKTLLVGASKKLRNRVKRGFRKHRRIRAHVRIRVTDAAGNRTNKSITIKIKRRGR